MAALRASTLSFGLSTFRDGLSQFCVSYVSVRSNSSARFLPQERAAVECGLTRDCLSFVAGYRNSMKVLNATVDEKAALGLEFSNTTPAKDSLLLWQAADAVCFDVDSTVCIDEGIDELAKFCGAGEAVAAWTSRAMGGSVPFEEALAARLHLIQPSLSDLEAFLAAKPPKLSPRIEDLVKRLHSRGVHVYLVSGGFRQMIEPVAGLLQVPQEKIFANRLLFDEDGNYAGFDEQEPTSKSGGKAIAISRIKQKHGYRSLVMIGDGATDLEAKKPGAADMFICFGGVQIRPAVAAGADWFISSFEDLIQALEKNANA